jgi:hypothetical protein
MISATNFALWDLNIARAMSFSVRPRGDVPTVGVPNRTFSPPRVYKNAE